VTDWNLFVANTTEPLELHKDEPYATTCRLHQRTHELHHVTLVVLCRASRDLKPRLLGHGVSPTTPRARHYGGE
jgi:hypothetical protein